MSLIPVGCAFYFVFRLGGPDPSYLFRPFLLHFFVPILRRFPQLKDVPGPRLPRPAGSLPRIRKPNLLDSQRYHLPFFFIQHSLSHFLASHFFPRQTTSPRRSHHRSETISSTQSSNPLIRQSVSMDHCRTRRNPRNSKHRPHRSTQQSEMAASTTKARRDASGQDGREGNETAGTSSSNERETGRCRLLPLHVEMVARSREPLAALPTTRDVRYQHWLHPCMLASLDPSFRSHLADKSTTIQAVSLEWNAPETEIWNTIHVVALRCGFMSLAQLPAVIALSGRNSLVQFLTGIEYQHLRFAHKVR